MQQKKNIRLAIILVILLAVTVVVVINKPDGNKLDIDKSYFALKEKVNDLDAIRIVKDTSIISLQKSGRQWLLNESQTADPNKINDLLGILSEVSVRRKAASNVQQKISSTEHQKFKVTLSSNNQEVSSFEVAENDQGTLTYFIDDIAYVVNIPGYNFHIADIFELSHSDWRSPYVFASNWTTLDKMKISYPSNQASNFEIVYDKLGYAMPGINALDSAKMYDYMQQISFLQVMEFLNSVDPIEDSADINITVEDVGGKEMILDFFLFEEDILGRINNQEWANFDRNTVLDLLKKKEDFELLR